jgi:ABC-2 type transport system ATP-binding protein
VFSTHITSDIERVADTVAIVKDGRISFHGDLSDLKDSVKRLRITAENSLPNMFAVPGALSGHAQIETEDLNLEDIFLELHHAS